jgi:hypothetical protein
VTASRRWAACWALALVAGAVAGRPAGAGEREVLEPRPPWIFFSKPSPQTAAEIEDVVTGTFADLGKVAWGRDLLVFRYGLVSVPRLADEAKGNNVTLTWNALLTLSALRDRFGPARELWPALEPITGVLRKGGEPYKKAFAALAIGSFHGSDTIPVSRGAESILDVRGAPSALAREALATADRVLADVLLDEPVSDVRSAAAFALAKRGGADSGRGRKALLDPACWQDGFGVEPRQAVILALGLLPGPGDDDRFLGALRHEEVRIRQAAALGIALQAVGEDAPRWATVAPLSILRALKADPVRLHLADGAETVFARGVLALRGNVPGEWDLLYDVARDTNAADEAAAAAAQVLLFDPRPSLAEQAIAALRSGSVLKDPVVAAFLRIAGASGTEPGIALVRDYLGNRGKLPKGDETWNVRYHAVIGLLRAFVAGGLKDPALRSEAVQALHTAVKRGLPEGLFRTRLESLLDKRRLAFADPKALLPEADLLAMEASFTCPHALLSHDIEDVAVHRLNAMVPPILHIHARRSTVGEPDKTDQPQRFLRVYLERFPYFRRIEFRTARGLRSVEVMDGDPDPEREVRFPP